MNLWERFVNEDPKISEKINGIGKIDPIAEMVDSALEDWTSKKRDVIFEFTPERREMLIKMVKKTIKYDSIQDSPFYQYLRAYILHLYFWLVKLQKYAVEAGEKRSVDYMESFDEIIAEAFILGYSMKALEKAPKKKGRG